MNQRRTIFAACLLALSAAVVLFRHPIPAATGSAAPAPPAPPAKPEPTVRPAAATGRFKSPAAKREESRGETVRVLDSAQRRAARQAAQAQAAADHEIPTQAELERRAQLVERDASHELARLVPLLDLKPDQQQRVFQALARTSPNFVPGMKVDGNTLLPSAADPQKSVLAELSDSQVTAYLQDSDERSAWWTEYVGNVASQLATGTPAVSGGTATVATTPAGATTTPVETAPATKDAHVISGTE